MMSNSYSSTRQRSEARRLSRDNGQYQQVLIDPSLTVMKRPSPERNLGEAWARRQQEKGLPHHVIQRKYCTGSRCSRPITHKQLQVVEFRELTEEPGQGCGVGRHPSPPIVFVGRLGRTLVERFAPSLQCAPGLRRIQGVGPLGCCAHPHRCQSREERGV